MDGAGAQCRGAPAVTWGLSVRQSIFRRRTAKLLLIAGVLLGLHAAAHGLLPRLAAAPARAILAGALPLMRTLLYAAFFVVLVSGRLSHAAPARAGIRSRGEDARSRGEDARSRGEDARSRVRWADLGLAGLVLALLLGTGEQILSILLYEPARFGVLSRLAVSSALSTALFLLGLGSAALLIGAALARGSRAAAAVPLLIACAAYGALAALYLLIDPMFSWDWSLVSLQHPLVGLFLLLPAAAFYFFARGGGGDPGGWPDRRERFRRWASPVALLTVLLLLQLWLSVYRCSGSTATILPVAFGIVGAAGILASRRLAPLLLPGGLLLLVLASPLIVSGLTPASSPRAASRTAGATVASGSSCSSAAAGSHPIDQVIMIIVDSLRPDFLSCYGSERVQTPHIDRLAADGVRFRTAISAAPWTLPSVSSILTGLPADAHMTVTASARLPDSVRTVAEQMRAAGFHTAAIVHNAYLSDQQNVDQGFSEYSQYPRPMLAGSTVGEELLERLPFGPGRPDRTTAEIADEAISWLEEHQEETFFLWVHIFDPHMPYAPERDYLPDREGPVSIGDAFDDLRAVRGGYFAPDHEEREWIRELYAAEVRYVDENIGRIVAALKRMGLYDPSLILFLSDHGEEFWEHDGFEHGHTLYEEVLRVPLIVKLPRRQAAGRVVSHAVTTESVAPTLLDLCGIAREKSKDDAAGLSVHWAGVDSLNSVWGRPIYSTGQLYYADHEAILFGRHKYIVSRVDGAEELYDLKADPGETVSIAPQKPELLDRARRHLAAHHQRAQRLRERLGISGTEQTELDPGTIRRLRSLGYME